MSEFNLHEDENWNYRPLLFTVVIFLICFLAWAGLSEIDQQVRTSGRIIPAGQAQLVQHLEGGIIDRILVKEGERVEKGQPLFQIRNQKASSELEGNKLVLSAFDIKLQRLQAEFEGKEKFIVEDMDLTEGLSEIAQNEIRLFNSRVKAFEDRVEVFKEREKQKELKLEDLNLQLRNLKAERAIAQDQLNINEKLRKTGAISESRYLDSKSKVGNFTTRIGSIEKQMPVTRAELEEVRQQMEELAEKRKTEVLDEINAVELERQRLEEQLKADLDQVQRTAIYSPVTGMVNKIYVNTLGGVVSPGSVIAEIIPLEDSLIVEARMHTKDRGLVWNGLPANVKITAYDSTIYGTLNGEITEISADSFTDETTGTPFYRVKITLDTESIQNFEPIYPGMTVEANILSGRTSVLRAIFKPLLRLKENALREP